jgi:hypothetical protein
LVNVNGAWDNAASLNSRILVAGGGGGSGFDPNGARTSNGGAAGGLTGYEGAPINTTGTIRSGKGGTQTGGGAGVSSGAYSTQPGSFGKGSATYGNNPGGGGSGYYGGSGAIRTGDVGSAGGGGGSSFISGMTNCVAINPAVNTTNNPRTKDTGTTNTQALNYHDTLFGTSPTWSDGDEIEFTNWSMVDGQGYQWNTGAKAGSATGMPNHANNSTMTGNTGHGYARITLLP